MDAQRMITIQQQIRQNQEEFNDYVKSISSWADEMKSKEKEGGSAAEVADADLPPVRNSLLKKKKKKRAKPVNEQKDKLESAKSGKGKITAYDYRAWDKFDVDAALEDIEKQSGRADKDDDDEYETDEEWEEERRILLAKEEKEKGNAHFKAGKWDLAVECYTTAIRLDPSNPLLYTNRAMAQIRAERLGAAIADCSAALSLDPHNTKALYRRGMARKGLGRGHEEEALADFEKLLTLDPDSKTAKAEVEALEKIVRPTGEVKAITKDPATRSKKPLRRITIEEVGFAESQSAAVKKPEPALEEFLKERSTSYTSSASAKTSTSAEKPSPGPKIVEESSAAVTPASILSQNSKEVKSDDMEGGSSMPKSGGGGESKVCSGPAGDVSTTKRDPCPPPTNFGQFQSTFSSLKYRGEAELHEYLRSIPPSDYKKVFGQCLEPSHVNALLSALAGSDVDLAVSGLRVLRTVPRFSFLSMMVGSKERESLRILRQRLLEQKRIDEAEAKRIGTDFRL